jgi:hypothetical protein
VKSGWKTTEAWLTMLLLGGLATAMQELINSLPQLLAAAPPWAAPLAPIAVVGLGWVAKRVLVEYTKSRVALKLGTDPAADAAAAAGTGGPKSIWTILPSHAGRAPPAPYILRMRALAKYLASVATSSPSGTPIALYFWK